jgi:hypothetical protein
MDRLAAIDLGLGLAAFPFLASFFPPCFYFTLFLLYYFEGRLASYVPTVSETGTEHPNAHFMSIAFSHVASVIISLGLVMHFYTSALYRPSRLLRLLMLLSVIVGTAGFIALSNYPVTVDPVRHHFWTFMGLTGVIAIQLFSWFAVRATCTVGENVTRCCLVIGQFAFLLVCGFTDVFVETRARISLAAISEYAILVLLPMFFFSFSRDLATVSQLLVIQIDST